MNGKLGGTSRFRKKDGDHSEWKPNEDRILQHIIMFSLVQS